jgi:large subunit ribosomal protein L31
MSISLQYLTVVLEYNCMKQGIHPKTFLTTATCTCGAKYDVISTKKDIKIDICSACHPLFTGKEKLLDTEGRIQKFKKKYAGVKIKIKKPKKKTAKKTAAKNKTVKAKK